MDNVTRLHGPSETERKLRLMKYSGEMADLLLDAIEVLGNYADTDDGPYGPVPNRALKLTGHIQLLLEEAGVEP